MREYIARNPKTGEPLRTSRQISHGLELAYRPGEGAWDALPMSKILPLAKGESEVESVIWKDKEHLLRRSDAIRALPRIRGKNQNEAHKALESALGDLEPRLRIAGLESLPYCALQHSESLFEHLEELHPLGHLEKHPLLSTPRISF